ncbi:hypothetical protein [Streptosporangium roseum]|uniref:hypothetical protein n=1 Tax=Streptosporangium roseum TaxID=2001 RepID=UPI00331F6279
MTRMVRTVSVTGSARARQRAHLRERLHAAVRGALAVLVLLVTAADAWLTALLGLPPITPVLHRLTGVIADAWRSGAAGAIDAEVIDDPEQEVWP